MDYLSAPTVEMLGAALLAISADLPAMRTVTQFGCPRCKFQAEREPGITGQLEK